MDTQLNAQQSARDFSGSLAILFFRLLTVTLFIIFLVVVYSVSQLSTGDCTMRSLSGRQRQSIWPQAWTVWFTGLSGSGKSTLARALASYLDGLSIDYELIDGDEIRRDLCRDLGFTKKDRDENIRRIGYVARLLNRHHVVSIVAAISPFREARSQVRNKIPRFLEVHIDCSLPVLVKRDVKGLYKRALAGELKNFSGVSGPYEPPLRPDIYLNSGKQSEEECLALIVTRLEDLNWIPGPLTNASSRQLRVPAEVSFGTAPA